MNEDSSLAEPLVRPGRHASDHGSGGRTRCRVSLLLALAIVGNGAFLFGYHLAVINGPLPQIAKDFDVADSANLQGMVVSSALAGGAIGSLGGSGLADKFGRRRSLMLACGPLLLGELLLTSAWHFWVLVAGRLLVGVGIGLTSYLVPVYISEISPTELRGCLGSMNQLTITVGSLAALVINETLTFERWRGAMALSGIPTLALLLGMAGLCPESPRWLMAQPDSAANAVEAGNRLWGEGEGEHLQEEYVEGGEQGDEPPSSSFLEIFSRPNRSVAVAAIMMFVLQQYAGINALVYFSTGIFEEAGIAAGPLASVVLFSTNIAGTAVSSSLMDRLGRRQLITGSYIGMGLSMATMALFMATPALKSLSGAVSVAGAIIYILCFALGAGPVPGLYIPEISPHDIRGRAVALAMTSHWINNFLVGQLFLPLSELIGVAGVYIIFALVCGAGAAYSSLCMVETKGRSLEEIEAEMNG